MAISAAAWRCSATDLVRRDAKLDRWAEKYFHLEYPWDGEIGEFIAEQGLESGTEFDSALGSIDRRWQSLRRIAGGEKQIVDAEVPFASSVLARNSSSCSFTAARVVWANQSCARMWTGISARVWTPNRSPRRIICAGHGLRRAMGQSRPRTHRAPICGEQSVRKRSASGMAGHNSILAAQARMCGSIAKALWRLKLVSWSSPVHAVP